MQMINSILGAILFVPYLLCFAAAVYTDIRTLTIPDWIPLTLLGVGVLKLVFSFSWESLISSLAGLVGIGLLLLIPTLFVDGIGGGDIKLCAAAAYVIGLRRAVPALIISLVLAILYALLFKRGKGKALELPLAPFLFIGHVIAYLL